jgi:hypothetical protein
MDFREYLVIRVSSLSGLPLFKAVSQADGMFTSKGGIKGKNYLLNIMLRSGSEGCYRTDQSFILSVFSIQRFHVIPDDPVGDIITKLLAGFAREPEMNPGHNTRVCVFVCRLAE